MDTVKGTGNMTNVSVYYERITKNIFDILVRYPEIIRLYHRGDASMCSVFIFIA